MKKHQLGKCALCRRECELTFEHIPPRAALNGQPVKSVSGQDFIGTDRKPWDISKLPYTNLQRGLGRYSLCNECNNNTGSWYGEEYLYMVKAAYKMLSVRKEEPVESFVIKNFHPQRFIKRVISMFCSINNCDDERMQPLREFVLDRNSTNLDKSKYKICMYFTESVLEKQNGLSVTVKLFDKGFAAMAISEITAFPLGFLLYFDPIDEWEYRGIDITSFGTAKYDDHYDLEVPLVVFEVNSWITGDFRTKREIEMCIEENKSGAMEYDVQSDPSL